MHVRMCMHACTYVYACMYVSVCMHVRMCMHACTYVYACMYVSVCMHVRMCMHVCGSNQEYTYIVLQYKAVYVYNLTWRIQYKPSCCVFVELSYSTLCNLNTEGILEPCHLHLLLSTCLTYNNVSNIKVTVHCLLINYS